MISYIQATSYTEYKAAENLFREYAAWLSIDLRFQHFEEELTQLKKMYAAPAGGIILCKEDNEWIGCVAIRKINSEIAELKRMYVQPLHQRKGIGKRLLEEAIVLANQYHYIFMRLDTLNYMIPAIALYKQCGFYEIAPYYFNPNPTAVFFEKKI